MVGSLAGLQGMEAGILVLVGDQGVGGREGAYGIFLAAGAAGNLSGACGPTDWSAVSETAKP